MSSWYAIRTKKDSLAEQILSCEAAVEEVYYPKEIIKTRDGQQRTRAYIPHVLFVRTTEADIKSFETRGRTPEDNMPPLWIYRDCRGGDIQPIPTSQMSLLKLLTATDSTRCEVYRREDYKPGQTVRVTSGPFKDYVGTVQRIGKNRHVVVRIEGICAVMLPFIHPDLLEKV